MGLGTSVLIGLISGVGLVILFAVFHPFVNSDTANEEKVWVAYTPIQCEDAPWKNVDLSDMPSEYRGSGAAYAAAKYYRAIGIVVYDFNVTPGRIVPAACGFPAGYEVLLQVPEVQLSRMQLFGFRVHDGPAPDDILRQEPNTQDTVDDANAQNQNRSTSNVQSGMPVELDVVSANNQFAIDLYRQLSVDESESGIFFSPWSISSAFAIAYEGAGSDTATEIQGLFPFSGRCRSAKSFV